MPQSCDQKTIIACSALQRQLDTTVDELNLPVKIQYLDAVLHLRPEKLKEKLVNAIKQSQDRGDEIKIVFGNCCSGIDEICDHYKADRINMENCYQIFLGDYYSDLIQDEPGTYFLDFFLSNNFEDLVIKQLGMDRNPKLKKMFFSHYKKLVYIDIYDTGLTEQAQAIAKYLSLPIKAVKGDNDRFQKLFCDIL